MSKRVQICPYCGSTKMRKAGFRRWKPKYKDKGNREIPNTETKVKQRYECRKCRRTSTTKKYKTVE